MWLLLLSLVANAVDPVCERASWRRETAKAARDDHTSPAIDRLIQGTSTGTRSCPAVDLPPACMSEGVSRARSGSVAFQLLIDAVEASQKHKDVGTLLHERKQAFLARGAKPGIQARSGGIPMVRSGSVLDADHVIERVPGQLVLRGEADDAVFEAEAVWMAAARAWNGARCACDEVCVPGPGSFERQLARLRTLHEDLVKAQQSLLTRWDMDTLIARLEHGGAGDVGEGLLMARVALLQSTLAEHGGRPHAARHRLTTVLATLDGHNHRGTDAQSTLVSWLMYDRAWRRQYARLDKGIDKIIAAWARIDTTESGPALDVANSRLKRAFHTLENGNPGTPATLRVR